MRRTPVRAARRYAHAALAGVMLGMAAGVAAEETAPPERDPAREVLPRRPGPSEPQRYVPPPPDPSQVAPPTAAAPREALPVPDQIGRAHV